MNYTYDITAIHNKTNIKSIKCRQIRLKSVNFFTIIQNTILKFTTNQIIPHNERSGNIIFIPVQKNVF